MGHSGETTDSFLPQQGRDGSNQKHAWKRLALAYLRDLPGQLDAIIRLLETEDYSAIGDHAHRMKGTSGTYRLDAIAAHFARLEHLALDRDGQQIAALVEAISSVVETEARAIGLNATESDDRQAGETND